MGNENWYENVVPSYLNNVKKNRISFIIMPIAGSSLAILFIWFVMKSQDRQFGMDVVIICVAVAIAGVVLVYHIFTDILNRTPVKVAFLQAGMLLFELRGKERFVPYEDIVAVSRHPSYDDYEEYRYYVFSYKRKKRHKIPYSEVLTWENKSRLVSILSELQKQGKWSGKIEV